MPGRARRRVISSPSMPIQSEISILIGTLMGTRLLGEGDAPRRLAGAGAMVLGVVALANG